MYQSRRIGSVTAPFEHFKANLQHSFAALATQAVKRRTYKTDGMSTLLLWTGLSFEREGHRVQIQVWEEWQYIRVYLCLSFRMCAQGLPNPRCTWKTMEWPLSSSLTSSSV